MARRPLPANDSDSADDGLTVRFDHVGYSYDDAGHGDSKSASAKTDKQGETSPNSAVAPALTNITFAARPVSSPPLLASPVPASPRPPRCSPVHWPVTEVRSR